MKKRSAATTVDDILDGVTSSAKLIYCNYCLNTWSVKTDAGDTRRQMIDHLIEYHGERYALDEESANG